MRTLWRQSSQFIATGLGGSSARTFHPRATLDNTPWLTILYASFLALAAAGFAIYSR